MVTHHGSCKPISLKAAAKRSYWATKCFGLGLEEYKKMPLVNLVIALIIVGVALYMINRYIPMASSIKTILNVVVVVAVCVWLLQAVGLWGDVSNFRLTRTTLSR